MKHDFTDFEIINGQQTCKHCLITRNNEYLPTRCPYKKKEQSNDKDS